MYRIVTICVLTLFLCLKFSWKIAAQEANKSIILTGNVYRSDTLLPIPFATIMDKRTHLGTSCNENGYFSFSARANDTLVFSSIGFESLEYIVDEKSLNEKKALKISLNPKTYELEGIKVVGYKSYTDFKKDFVKLDIPEEKIMFFPKPPPVVGSSIPTLSFSGPFSALYQRFGQRPNEVRKAADMRLQNQKWKMVSARYNKEFVSNVLKIKEEELEKFMDFCHLPHDFILASTDYDLALAIKECYSTFKSKQM